MGTEPSHQDFNPAAFGPHPSSTGKWEVHPSASPRATDTFGLGRVMWWALSTLIVLVIVLLIVWF